MMILFALTIFPAGFFSSKWKKRNMQEDDEEPYEYVSKPVRAPVIENVTKTVKQPKETIYHTPIKKEHPFKKKIYIITFICIGLLVIALIGYNVNYSNRYEAYRHYKATVDEKSYSSFTVGCGSNSCPYCEGVKITVRNKTAALSMYDAELNAFYEYNETQSKMRFFEDIGNILLIASIFFAGLSLIIFVTSAIKKAVAGQDLEE